MCDGVSPDEEELALMATQELTRNTLESLASRGASDGDILSAAIAHRAAVEAVHHAHCVKHHAAGAA